MRYLIRMYHNRSFLKNLKPQHIMAWLLVFSACLSALFLAGINPSGVAGCVLSGTAAPAGDYCAYPVSFLNDRTGDITGAVALNAPGFIVPEGLTGKGQIVAVADSGLDAGLTDDIHPDLRSLPGQMPKVVLLKSWSGREVPDDPVGHGTHMAATIAGTGAASNGQFRGIAPGASIYFQAILNSIGEPEPPADLEGLFYPAYSAGARIHVDGWGGGSNSYTEAASQVDDFIRRYPDFLAIFGAGNSGLQNSTITGEANSKNALVVGASNLPRPAFAPGEEDTTAVAGFSSRGPSGDGRIKPELLAPASAVISARSRLVEGNLAGYTEYTRLQGTSMAAAVAGGSSALLREYFKEHMEISTPSAALTKAALVNGARTGAVGPSQEGFGVIDLAGTVIALKESTFTLADEWAGVSQGEELTYTFRVSDTAVPFKATLAWTDLQAEAGSSRALVNDLDLKVLTPDGKVYNGNHFLGANSPDRKNNVEQVFLPLPAPGIYNVKVTGAAVRRNTVPGSGVPLQDFALVWGQKPALGLVERYDGRTVYLADGSSFGMKDYAAVNLVNGAVSPVDQEHVFTGAAVFQAPEKAYLAARLWREVGVKALNTVGGTVFTEMNQAARLGGYNLAPGTAEIMLNNTMAPLESMPPGVEIGAVITPYDQKIRQVRADYAVRSGVVLDLREERGQKTLYLAGGHAYRISPEAAYSYEESYADADKTNMPFGTGALVQVEEVLPGMTVVVHLAPSSGEIQYLAVKRMVSMGTVSEVKATENEIILASGAGYKVLPGAQVKRDGQASSLEAVQPGDHITAVILPDTGEAIGLVVFSSVLYGKSIDYTGKNRVIYFIDDDGQYRVLRLDEEAVIFRWGIRTSVDAIAAGSRIRVVTDPEGKVVRQLDIAETLRGRGILEAVYAGDGIVTTAGGDAYTMSGTTRFYKNGYPVTMADLRPGEYVELEYTAAPPPTGRVLLAVSANSVAPPPQFTASVISLRDRVVVAGRAGEYAAVYVWQGTAARPAPADESGRFYLALKSAEAGCGLVIVVADRHNGGVAGEQAVCPGAGLMAKNVDDVLNTVLAAAPATQPDGAPPLLPAGRLITRAEAAAVLARLLNWPAASAWPLPFTDAADIPSAYRPAVAEACARGIFRGYNDGSFLPAAFLGRAEAAAVFASAMEDLGLGGMPVSALPYSDASNMPAWAAPYVAEATAADLFLDRRGALFAPAEMVDYGEMAVLLNRFLDYCEAAFQK